MARKVSNDDKKMTEQERMDAIIKLMAEKKKEGVSWWRYVSSNSELTPWYGFGTESDAKKYAAIINEGIKTDAYKWSVINPMFELDEDEQIEFLRFPMDLDFEVKNA